MDNNACDELYISYLFPPDNFVSGITVFKRIVENNRKVDLLQANINSNSSLKHDDNFDEYVNNRIIIDMDCANDWADCILKFVKKGINAINDDYKKIYSRSWLMANHFLAFEYKYHNRNVFWTAEFSDPLIFDLNNNPKTYKQMIVDDKSYIDKINNMISDFNNENNSQYPMVEYFSSAYFIAEYLVYLFADKIIFSNENQCRIMLNQFPVDVSNLVLSKCEIKMHPTLDNKFYTIKKADLNLDDQYVNIAYFGNDYYGKRHFESLFYAVNALNHKYKDKIRVYIYISDDNLIRSLNSSDNFIIKKPLDYLEFLNATTQFDVLVVSDVVTKGNYELNPYLPSKLSDYLGSSADIWALYENGSTLSKFDLKYKSDINDFAACGEKLVEILNDHGFADDYYSFNEDYLLNRLTDLNEQYEKVFRRKDKLENEIRQLKNQNNELLSSNSWKITKPLRNLRNKR